MNLAHADRIAEAVLYEGYILYPYRPSVKNRQRWTFGGLYPKAYCETPSGSDAASNQTECLIQGDADTVVDVQVRFLHLAERMVGQLNPPLQHWQGGIEPSFHAVEKLRI